jgi:hypothetical protein
MMPQEDANNSGPLPNQQVNPSPENPSPEKYFAGSQDDFGLTPKPKVRTQRVDPLLGMDLGGVKIIRLLGEGGMGRVYEAEQESPRRTVAVKVVRQGITSEKTMRRFEREAEFLGKLQHPNIAQIHVVGSYASDIGDVPFFVMEYIPNAKPITNFAAENNLPLDEKLRLFKCVCEAVSHGHDRGVVHRDLKPGNILIDATGSPKIIDFGVARSTDSDFTLTSMKTDTGQLVGTVQYMSPEQFGDGPDDLDGRADVYSLGVVLYELIGGVLPYEVRKKKMHEAARIVCEYVPAPLKSLDRAMPRPVSLITERCLQKSRRDRYQSAGALAADIQRYLDGKPISQSMRGWLARTRNLARSRAAKLSMAVAVVLAVIAAAVFLDRAYRRPQVPDPTAAEAATLTQPQPQPVQELAAQEHAAQDSGKEPRSWVIGSWAGEIAGSRWKFEFDADGNFVERVADRVLDTGTWEPEPDNVIRVQPNLGGELTCRLVDGMLEFTKTSSSGLGSSRHVFRRATGSSMPADNSANNPPEKSLREQLLAVAEEAASASTAHNLPRLLKLMSREIPDRDLFISQCRKEWALTGLHYRLDKLEVLNKPDWEFPYAVAMVTLTIRDLSQDRDTRPPLPDDPLSHKMQLRTRVPTTRCEWLFKNEDGAWKIVANLTEPEPAEPN